MASNIPAYQAYGKAFDTKTGYLSPVVIVNYSDVKDPKNVDKIRVFEVSLL